MNKYDEHFYDNIIIQLAFVPENVLSCDNTVAVSMPDSLAV